MTRVVESIYNLIPKEEIPPEKVPRYKSKYPPTIPPTYSTLCHKTTSRPGITNPHGEFSIMGGTHSHRALSATFGLLKGSAKQSPASYTKKGSGPFLRALSKKCHYINEDRRPAIPDKADKPIMGLVSEKNYIIANAVENILAAPKKIQEEKFNYLTIKNYGKVPKYIEKIKKEIDDEYQIVKDLHIQEEDEKMKEKYLMPDDERRDLIAALKKKWEIVHHEYKEIGHITKMDTIGLRRK